MSGRPIALITGASKGIGAAVAQVLARDGFDLWLNYRGDHDGAKDTAAGAETQGGRCVLLPFDVADPEAVDAALDPLLAETVPHVLVNNAGFARDNLMVFTGFKDWEAVLDVHLNGFFLVTKKVLFHMLRLRRGRIVNIASTSGQTGVAGQVAYSSAKAGLIGATRSLAAEVAKRGILVNAVAPGFVDTAMTRELPLERILPLIPLKRLGTPQDVAEAVSFLCSPSSSYITGQTLAVNGGIYM